MRSIHKDHLQASFYDRRKILCALKLHVYLCFCSRIRVSSQSSQLQRWSCLFFVWHVDLHMACLFQVCSIIVSHTKKSHVPSPVYQYTLGLESCASWQLRVCSPHYVKLLFISLSTGIGNLPYASSILAWFVSQGHCFRSTSIGVVLCACRVHVYRTSDASVLPSET